MTLGRYWKGPTWLDQTWFAYTGLKHYAAAAMGAAPSTGGGGGGVDMAALATEIRRRTLAVGQGFPAGDTTPLNEHYDAQTCPAGRSARSSSDWTAAHALMIVGVRGPRRLPRSGVSWQQLLLSC
jgi:hypothetical protein